MIASTRNAVRIGLTLLAALVVLPFALASGRDLKI